MSGVPQGSVLGPLLFNIFVNDFILAMKSTYVCNFADDNTIFACDKDVEVVAARLGDDVYGALVWFKSKRMMANPHKFQVIFLGLKQNEEFLLEIGNIIVNATRYVKLLGITVDDELKVEKHVKTLYQNVYKKVCVLKGSTLHGRKEKENPVSYIYNVSIIVHLSGCFAVKSKTKK